MWQSETATDEQVNSEIEFIRSFRSNDPNDLPPLPPNIAGCPAPTHVGRHGVSQCAWLLWNQLLNPDLWRLHHTHQAFLSLAECNKVQRDLRMGHDDAREILRRMG